MSKGHRRRSTDRSYQENYESSTLFVPKWQKDLNEKRKKAAQEELQD